MNRPRVCGERPGPLRRLLSVLLLLCWGPLAAASAPETQFSTWLALRDAGVVRQERDYSCGLAALATYLSGYLQSPVTEGALLDLLAARGDDWSLPGDWRQQGVSYAILLRLAREYGVEGAGMAVTPELLWSLTVPAIVRLQVDGVAHFSLLRGVDAAGRVQLADPSWGNQVLGREAFLKLWLDQEHGADRGTLLLLQPLPGSGRVPVADYFGINRPGVLLRPPA